MEETHECLMWMKRKQILKSHIQAPFEACNNNNNINNKYSATTSSWEERAFAEDAARILGGCIWPPRSYSCSFCKREFRSAQALGGHMNVHRRDRARLKQNLSPPHHNHHNEALHHKNDCKSSSSSSFGAQFPNCSSSLATQEDFPKGVVSIAREQQILKGLMSCNDHDYVETGLSVGLNSVIDQKLGKDYSCGDHKGMSSSYNKRPKTCSIPVLLKPCSNDRLFKSAEFVLGLKPGMEDLDLELRLGKPQKV